MKVTCDGCGESLLIKLQDSGDLTTEDIFVDAELDWLCPCCRRPCSVGILVRAYPCRDLIHEKNGA